MKKFCPPCSLIASCSLNRYCRVRPYCLLYIMCCLYSQEYLQSTNPFGMTDLRFISQTIFTSNTNAISNPINKYVTNTYQVASIWTHLAWNYLPFISLDIFTSNTNAIKGQLISKCLFGVFNSPKKRTKTTGRFFCQQTTPNLKNVRQISVLGRTND